MLSWSVVVWLAADAFLLSFGAMLAVHAYKQRMRRKIRERKLRDKAFDESQALKNELAAEIANAAQLIRNAGVPLMASTLQAQLQKGTIVPAGKQVFVAVDPQDPSRINVLFHTLANELALPAGALIDAQLASAAARAVNELPGGAVVPQLVPDWARGEAYLPQVFYSGPRSIVGCMHCVSGLDVAYESARTAYVPTPECPAPNLPIPLCRSCAVQHHAYWDQMWSDYHGGLL